MHNGEVAGFSVFKRKLQASLSDEIFSIVKGNTGSLDHTSGGIGSNLRPLRFRVDVCTFSLKGKSFAISDEGMVLIFP